MRGSGKERLKGRLKEQSLDCAYLFVCSLILTNKAFAFAIGQLLSPYTVAAIDRIGSDLIHMNEDSLLFSRLIGATELA